MRWNDCAFDSKAVPSEDLWRCTGLASFAVAMCSVLTVTRRIFSSIAFLAKAAVRSHNGIVDLFVTRRLSFQISRKKGPVQN